ncbi:MAG: UTP--glucose-1-phosphate uridylyltransferase GalU [Caldisericaceae bacterium]
MAEIKKAVIPVAGFGTRLLPATKAQPKEMLPVVDKPAVQYIVEEAVYSGIEDLLFVTGRGKRAIEDYFDYAFELEQELEIKGKTDLLKQVKEVSEMVKIFYIRQKIARGLGDAVYQAKGFVNNETFATMLADDIIDGDKPCLAQMKAVYDNFQGIILAVMKIPIGQTNMYGIIEGDKVAQRVYRVKGLVEKPEPAEAPSNLAIVGRYLLTKDIFWALENTEPGKGGEIQLTDAINKTLAKVDVYAYEFKGTRYDVGDKLGYLKANIALALKRDDFGKELKSFIKKIIEN